MLKKLTVTTILALVTTATSAQEFTSSSVREFAIETFAVVTKEDEAYALGRASWFGDLCTHRYDIDPWLAMFLDVQFSDLEAFESGVPPNLLTEYHNGFYETVDVYRAMKAKYPNDWGRAKDITCGTLHSLFPEMGTLK